MRNFFIKNAGYKKMNYIDTKYINISLREKKIKRKLLLKRIISIIQAFSLLFFILFLFYLVLKKLLKISKEIKHKINIATWPNMDNQLINNYYHNLSLNYTTQNYKVKRIPDEDLKIYLEYMDKSRLGIFLNRSNIKTVENPKVSIVISVYNREDYINSTIRSVQNQNLSEIEILIIDDYSTDNTIEYIKEMQKIDPRIKLYKNSKNMGTLYSKSIGVLNARGQYIYSLDSDDMLCREDYLDTIYNEAIRGNLDFVQCDAIYLDEIAKKISKRSPFWVVLWSKLIKTKFYRKAIYKLGEEVLSNKVVVLDDDIIALFLFTSGRSKKVEIIGVCHFVHFSSHVFFNQFMNHNNTKRYCLNMISTIDSLYKLKKYFYGDFLLKYLYVGGPCSRYKKLNETQKIIEEFKRHNATKKI